MARLGGKLASRPLHFIFLVDCSGSMSVAGKIRSLNVAIREAVPHMKRVVDENPNVDLLVRVVAFSSGARWHVSEPTPIKDFVWTDLEAEGVTDMGQALALVAEQLRVPPMTKRAMSPILVLISDGQPTDDFEVGLTALLAEPWGLRAVRLAIAIGRDADVEVLQRFIGDGDTRPFQANRAEDLIAYIRWASTVLPGAVSQGKETARRPPVSVPSASKSSGDDLTW